MPLGYGHEGIAEAVAVALRDASYLTLFRGIHRPAQDAADALLDLTGRAAYRRVIFSTSGGAANDAMMKLARHYHVERGERVRNLVVGLRGSYHGLMYGSHSLSGDALAQGAYSLDRRAVRHVDPADGAAQLASLLHREGAHVAAVVLEPVLGTGAIPLDPGYVEAVLDLRDRYGFLVVADEVATGFGRTGTLFASSSWSRPPDILVLSKALTNGALGAAALVVGSRVATEFRHRRTTFVHGETQAGTPAVAAAIRATAEQFRLAATGEAAERVAHGVRLIADGLVHDGAAREVRGRGAFLALALRDPSRRPGPAGSNDARLSVDRVARVVRAIADAGAVVHPGIDGIQLIPAYGMSARELDELDTAIRAGLAQIEKEAA